MSALKDLDTDQLLQSVADGDRRAVDQLLHRHRQRLRQLVSVRLSPDLAGRIDPSDVVQETLTTAHQRLDDYVRRRPIAFYPWLRQIALNRLIDLYRHHVLSAKRTTDREARHTLGLSEYSATRLAGQLIDQQSSPSEQLMRDELKRRVMHALERLRREDREIVVMRHLEELSVKEISDILEIPAGTVMSRHFQAVRKLRRWLDA